MATIDDIFARVVARIRALEARERPASSYYNLLVNGGFEFWSAGAGPFTLNADQVADKWYIQLGAGSTISVTQETTDFDPHFSANAIKAVYTHGVETFILHTVFGPYASNVLSLSVRVRCNQPNAARVSIDGTSYSAYHSGSGQYETLTVIAAPTELAGVNFNIMCVLDASCTAYFDSAMLVQGSAPIDHVAAITSDEQRRITDYL